MPVLSRRALQIFVAKQPFPCAARLSVREFQQYACAELERRLDEQEEPTDEQMADTFDTIAEEYNEQCQRRRQLAQ